MRGVCQQEKGGLSLQKPCARSPSTWLQGANSAAVLDLTSLKVTCDDESLAGRVERAVKRFLCAVAQHEQNTC